MTKKILIPIDSSDYSKTAVQYGIYIAKYLEAGLVGLHVIDLKVIQGPLLGEIAVYSGLPAFYEIQPKIEDALQKRGEKLLADFRETCEKSGIRPETQIVKGLIDDAIIAEGEKADWTLLAKRGEHVHLTQGALLGSTAEGVVRKSRKPVLITPREFREIESMGLAYDGSGPAENALKLAAELSEKTRWPLTVLMVTEDNALADRLRVKIDSILEGREIDSDVIVLRGREDREILKFIQEGAVELMIMGAFGSGRVKELFLGSTTSHIMRKSQIPVLLTR